MKSYVLDKQGGKGGFICSDALHHEQSWEREVFCLTRVGKTVENDKIKK